MEDQVEEIKRKTDIVGVVGTYVVLKKVGRHHKGLCPFHAEKTPSFMVNEEMGLYKCFGCGVGGDVIKFLMEIEGIEFREALERLAERAGVKLITRRSEGSDEREKMLEVMDLAARYYHWLLTEGKAGQEAREYLLERKINDKLIETFNIGFALPKWDGLTNYLTRKKGYKIDLLEKVGLVSPKNQGDGVYDKFRGRIMFPLQDTGGKVVGFTGRILPALAKESEPKYLNSPETVLYHKGRMLYGFYQAKKAIRENRRAILVEGQMDCISSFGAGITETVAVGGTALTEDQVEMLARLADKIFLSLDADEAGNVAMKRSVELAEKRGLSIKAVRIEGGKDPDEIARKSPGKWKEMVEKAEDVYQCVMERAFKKYDSKSIEGVKKIMEEVVPFLAKIENEVIRELWAKKLAKKLEVESRGVTEEIEKSIRGRTTMVSTKKEEPAEKSEETKLTKLAKRLAGLLLLNTEVREKIRPWFNDVTVAGAEGKLLNWILKEGAELPAEEIEKAVPEELKEVASEVDMLVGETKTPSVGEVSEVTQQLLKEILREKRKVLTQKMDEATRKGDEQGEEKYSKEIYELNKLESKSKVLLG